MPQGGVQTYRPKSHEGRHLSFIQGIADHCEHTESPSSKGLEQRPQHLAVGGPLEVAQLQRAYRRDVTLPVWWSAADHLSFRARLNSATQGQTHRVAGIGGTIPRRAVLDPS